MVVHLSEQRRAFVSGNVNWEDSQNSAGEGCHIISLLGLVECCPFLEEAPENSVV